MGDWYVFDEAEQHRGPITTDALVEEIRAKAISEDALVAPAVWFESPGASGWKRAKDHPEIAQALAAAGALDIRMVEGAFTSNRLGTPEFGATVMMVGNARRPRSGD